MGYSLAVGRVNQVLVAVVVVVVVMVMVMQLRPWNAKGF